MAKGCDYIVDIIQLFLLFLYKMADTAKLCGGMNGGTVTVWPDGYDCGERELGGQ